MVWSMVGVGVLADGSKGFTHVRGGDRFQEWEAAQPHHLHHHKQETPAMQIQLKVNGRAVNVASYNVKPGDVIEAFEIEEIAAKL